MLNTFFSRGGIIKKPFRCLHFIRKWFLYRLFHQQQSSTNRFNKLATLDWFTIQIYIHQTTSAHPERMNRRLHTTDRAFNCLPPFIWTGELLQSVHGSLIMWLPCCTMDPLHLSTSEHKLTPIICNAYSTPGTIRSLLSNISSPAAGIKLLLFSRSTTKNGSRNKPTNDITNISVERIYWITDFKMVLHVKILIAQPTLSELVWCFRKTVLLTLYSGTDCSTRSTQLTKQWSEVPSGVPTNTSIMLGASVITRSSLLPWQQCEWDSDPTAHDPTDYKSQQHFARAHQ